MRQRRIESFLVRIVIDEQHDIATNEWRGRMQHVGSGIEHQFDTLNSLMQLIHTQLDFDLAALPMHTPMPPATASSE